MTSTLDAALLSKSRAGAGLGRTSDVESAVSDLQKTITMLTARYCLNDKSKFSLLTNPLAHLKFIAN